VAQKIRRYPADLEFVLDDTLIADCSSLSELPVRPVLISLMTPVRFVFKGCDHAMLGNRCRKIEGILPMVTDTMGFDLEENTVALLFDGSDIYIDMTIADIGEFEFIRINVTPTASPPGPIMEKPPKPTEAEPRDPECPSGKLPILPTPAPIQSPAEPRASSNLQRYRIEMCAVVIPQFATFRFDPESTLAQIEPAVVAKWGLQSIETKFATISNVTEITRRRSQQTRLREISFDEDWIIRQAETIEDDPGEGTAGLAAAVSTSASTLTSTAARCMLLGVCRK